MAASSGAMLHHFKNKADQQRKRTQPGSYPVLHDYVLLDPIGRGAFGEVRLALNLNTMDRVAVKVILKDLARRKMSTANVRREIMIMQQVQHPNVVRFIDVYSTRSKIFIMMELVTGGELFHEVKYFGRLSEPYARFFFQQLVRGLDYCHSRGIYHRDLKLDNLLLDGDKTLKITDFGLSFMQEDSNPNPERMLHTPCGTPNYIAPEVVTRLPGGYEGDKADAWSCGCILFVMVCGYLPFDSTSLVGIFRQVARCAVDYPPYLSSDLIDLLDCIFEYDPKERFSLEQISRHRWFNGPVCTTMAGDNRTKADTISQMSQKIQEVVKSYMSYKETSAAQKIGVKVPVHVNPPINRMATKPLLHNDRKLNYAQKGNVYDSLAIGWLNDSMDNGFHLSGYHLAGETAEALSIARMQREAREVLPKLAPANFATHKRLPVPQMEQTAPDPPPIEVSKPIQEATEAAIEVIAKPSPEEINRVKEVLRQDSFNSDGTGLSTGSNKFLISDDDDSLDVENFKDHTRRTKLSLERQALRRTRSASAFGLLHNESQISSNGYSVSKVGKSQIVRVKLWDNFASEMRGESANAVSSTSTKFNHSNLSLSADLQRGELVKSVSYEGRFDSKSLRKRPRSKQDRDGYFPDSESETASSKITVNTSPRRERKTSVQESSPLANESSVRYAKDSVKEKDRTAESIFDRRKPLRPEYVQSQHLWCILMRDFDMIPDLEEFGLDRKSLEADWSKGLEKEDFMQSRALSPSTPVMNVNRSPAELHLRQRALQNSKDWKPMQNVQLTKMQISPPDMGHLSTSHSLPAKLVDREVYMGDLLTQDCIPTKLLKGFVEKTGFVFEESEPENEQRKYMKGKRGETEKYFNDIMAKIDCKQRKISGVISPAPVPNEVQPLKASERGLPPRNFDNMTITMSSPLMHGLAMESIIEGFSFMDDDENPTAHKPIVTIPEPAPQKQAQSVVMFGPLHEDYNRNGDPAVPNSSEAEQSKNEDVTRTRKRSEIDKLNIFQYNIRGPEIMPRLPQPTPFGRILRPVLQAGKRLILSPKHIFPIRKPLELRSLFNVVQCSDIVLELLARDGFEVSNDRNASAGKTKLRASISSDHLLLDIIVQVHAISDKLTGMEFKRHSGNHNSFLKFFDSFQDKYAAHIRSMPHE